MTSLRERARDDMNGRFYKVSEADAVWLDEVITEAQEDFKARCLEALPKRIDPRRFGYPMDSRDHHDDGFNDCLVEARAAIEALTTK